MTGRAASFNQSWPYPIRYHEEKEIETDVLIIGGGIAGCHAAISAARKGARVVVIDKASIVASGSGGVGVDHWHGAVTNPASRVTPEDWVTQAEKNEYGIAHEFGMGIACYILGKESYDALLDMEKMGMRIRDEDDDFVSAEFRDEESKLLFAYDYKNRFCIRVMGATVKPLLAKELKKLGVDIYEHVMTTSLLNEEGRQGSRVVGATGFNVRTGEFHIYRSKATIITTGHVDGGTQWVFNTELMGFASRFLDPNCNGDGHAIAWNAGAEVALMESGGPPSSGGFANLPYTTGNADNTWYGCTIVDSKGTEIPYMDRDGKELKTVSERFQPAPGQKLMIYPEIDYDFCTPGIATDIPDRIRRGELVPPFFADLPGMPELERKAIWGLMIPNEGKTKVPVYELFSKAGFDPEKDMLQASMVPIDMYTNEGPWWFGAGPPQWRSVGSKAGIVFDWDLRSSLEGLYVAGGPLMGQSNHAGAATTGRYAGRTASEFALNEAMTPRIHRDQAEREKARVYRQTGNKKGMGWKELQAGICRIMQDYCGEHKSAEILNSGLYWLNEIRTNELARAQVRNPHELWRTHECAVNLTVGEMVLRASLARKASSKFLNFNRLDCQTIDPPEWHKYITTKLVNGEVVEGELPIKYWLKPPYAPTYAENYEKHSALK